MRHLHTSRTSWTAAGCLTAPTLGSCMGILTLHTLLPLCILMNRSSSLQSLGGDSDGDQHCRRVCSSCSDNVGWHSVNIMFAVYLLPRTHSARCGLMQQCSTDHSTHYVAAVIMHHSDDGDRVIMNRKRDCNEMVETVPLPRRQRTESASRSGK